MSVNPVGDSTGLTAAALARQLVQDEQSMAAGEANQSVENLAISQPIAQPSVANQTWPAAQAAAVTVLTQDQLQVNQQILANQDLLTIRQAQVADRILASQDIQAAQEVVVTQVIRAGQDVQTTQNTAEGRSGDPIQAIQKAEAAAAAEAVNHDGLNQLL